MTPDFKRQARERVTKIIKKAGLAPGSYKMQEAYHKTQISLKDCKFKKCKRFDHAEKAMKRKLFVPAPGHYNIDVAETKVHK